MKNAEATAMALATALVPIIQPVLARRLEKISAAPPQVSRAPARPMPAPAVIPRDAVVAAAEALAAAVDRLEQVKFSREEGPARAALEKRARALRDVMRRMP